jgi:hypothetical protein
MSNLTPDDRALLARARLGVEPTTDDQARVKRRLFAQIGVGIGAATTAISTSTGASAGAAAATGATASIAKILGAVAIVSGVVATGIAVVHGSHAPVAPAPTSARPPQAEPPVQLAAGIGTPSTETAPSPAAPTLPGPAPTLERRGSYPAISGAAGHERALPARTVPAATGGSDLAPNATNVTAARPAPASVEDPSPNDPTNLGVGAGSAGALSPFESVGAEALLLRNADGAVRAGNAERALALLNEHAARFPHGVMIEEREAERVVVLCALGRTEEARTQASTFLREYPHSPLTVRVRASCGGS